MDRDRVVPTIEGHKSYANQLRTGYVNSLRSFQGRFSELAITTSEGSDAAPDPVAAERASMNMSFAVTETALSGLIGPNPQITASARNPASEDRVKAVESYVNYALHAGGYADQLTLGTFDAVVYGHGITKTMWSPELGSAVTESCSVYHTWFDLNTRDREKIRYWIGARAITASELAVLAKKGKYKLQNYDVAGHEYPDWMAPSTLPRALRDFVRWHVLYEVYDLEEGRIYHVLDGMHEPCYEAKLLYCPYDVLQLNNNGENCLGVSEVGLISSSQAELNNLLSYIQAIVHGAVPITLYDPADVDIEQTAKMAQAAPLGYVPISRRNRTPWSDLFGSRPQPNVPTDTWVLLDKVLSNISTVSALAEAQRGQVTGARTATELALIEGQLRTRLRLRQDRIQRLTARVAETSLFLGQQYLKTPQVIRLTGSEKWGSVDRNTLQSVRADFEMIPYNPMDNNRAVQQERFKELLQHLIGNPIVDQRALVKVIIDVFDSPALRLHNILVAEPQPAPAALATTTPEPAVVNADDIPASPAALPPEMQKIADLQAAGPLADSQAVPPPGPPVGGPQPAAGMGV